MPASTDALPHASSSPALASVAARLPMPDGAVPPEPTYSWPRIFAFGISPVFWPPCRATARRSYSSSSARNCCAVMPWKLYGSTAL